MVCNGLTNLPIGEWRDNETAGVSKVLVGILELSVGLSCDAVIDVSVPVESQLFEPFKRIGIGAAGLDEVFNDVARVNLDRHEGNDLQTLILSEIRAYRLGEFIQHHHLSG